MRESDPQGIHQAEIGGTTYRLRGTIGAGLEIQRRVGKSLVQLLSPLAEDPESLGLIEVVAMFEAFAEAGGTPLEDGALATLGLGEMDDLYTAVLETCFASGLLERREVETEGRKAGNAAEGKLSPTPGATGKP